MKDNPARRPVGVSGLMRVKDEEEFVEVCIDSVIDALDELIICYQACTDRTPEILERKRKEYPDKIKLYFYAPTVYSHNLTPEEMNYAYHLPDDSPHLLSSYYNYTLSKATYRYALKIDADQVYFRERMKRFCDAYRTDKRYKIALLERLAGQCLYGSLGYKQVIRQMMMKLISCVGDFGSIYEQYIIKRIANEKCQTWLSGINLFQRKGAFYIPDQFLYNGAIELCFFEITEDTWYYPARQYESALKLGRLIESFHYKPGVELYYGFMWYHMHGCKRKKQAYYQTKQGIECNRLRQVESSQLSHLLSEELKKFAPYAFFQDCDKSYPTYSENEKK